MSQSTRGHMLVPSAHVLWVQGGSSLAISGESVGPALDMALGLERGGGREAGSHPAPHSHPVTLWGGTHLLSRCVNVQDIRLNRSTR